MYINRLTAKNVDQDTLQIYVSCIVDDQYIEWYNFMSTEDRYPVWFCWGLTTSILVGHFASSPRERRKEIEEIVEMK